MNARRPVSQAPAVPSNRWRRLLVWGFCFLLVVLAADWSRPPDRQLSVHLFSGAIGLYQRTLSPQMPRVGVHCRFKPTCSVYARAVIEKDGAPRGLWRTAKRLLRCGPWTEAGTLDPP